MRKRQAIRIFYDYVTGVISTNDFWDLYKNNSELRDVLIKDRNRKKGKVKIGQGSTSYYLFFNDKEQRVNPDNLLEVIDINKLDDRCALFGVINRFLRMRRINVPQSKWNSDLQECWFLQSMLPDYVEIYDSETLQKIYDEAPADYNKDEKLAWCKSKIIEMYPYDKEPPDWVQDAAEWPIVDGIPLTFSHQETTEEGIERYYFHEKNSTQMTVVEQIE